MKIEKLPSGSYRVRKMYKNKMYTVVFSEKPTQKEALQALAAEMDKVHETKVAITFQIAASNYIESKDNVLSPSTVREYSSTINRLSAAFVDLKLSDITAEDVQIEINRLAKDRALKPYATTTASYQPF